MFATLHPAFNPLPSAPCCRPRTRLNLPHLSGRHCPFLRLHSEGPMRPQIGVNVLERRAETADESVSADAIKSVLSEEDECRPWPWPAADDPDLWSDSHGWFAARQDAIDRKAEAGWDYFVRLRKQVVADRLPLTCTLPCRHTFSLIKSYHCAV